MTSSSERGADVEQTACHYLLSKGLTHLTSNFRARTGEIDLIMLDSGCLVFVEVRYRRNQRFGGAAISVDTGKQGRIRRTAEVFRRHHPEFSGHPCRFDVISASGSAQRPTLQWLQRAF